MTLSITRRYKAVNNHLDTLKINEDDLYQFGCEFEFYIDTDRYDLQNAIEEIKNNYNNFMGQLKI